MKSFYYYDLNTSTNLDLRYHLFDENVFVGVAVFRCKQFRPFDIFLGRDKNQRYN